MLAARHDDDNDVYQIKWYSSTNIINLVLLVLRPKLVLLLTGVFSELSLSASASAFLMLKKHSVFYSSTIPEDMWDEPLYNIYIYSYIYHHHHHDDVVPPARISLTLSCHFYRSSPLTGHQGYILYPNIAAECVFELVVLLLPGHMWGSIEVHHL